MNHSFKIIDGHAHLASTRFVPEGFLRGVARNMKFALGTAAGRNSEEKLLDLLSRQLQDHEGHRLLAQMDSAGIEKTVLLLPDFTYVFKDAPLTIAEMISLHAEIAEKHPDRFELMVGVDPRWGKEGIDLFEASVKTHRVAGLKVYPPCGYRADDKRLYPYYEICAQHGLPVVIHVGPTSPALSFVEAHPLHVDTPAREFPGVNFILAHGGMVYVEESTMLCRYRHNVFLDLSASAAYPLNVLAYIENAAIHKKVIFGSDWPLVDAGTTISTELSRILGPDSPMGKLPPEARQRIFRENMLELLLRRKGAERPGEQ